MAIGGPPLRAIRFHATGGPEKLRRDEVAAPEPGPGEARVAVAFAGVNFIDVYLRTGLYDPGPLPAVAGREGAGVVDALGERASGFAIGDRVAFVDAVGSYAERALVPVDRLLRVPAGLSLEAAAALGLQGMTAHYLVRTIGRVGPGETVLVHAAAGGVGRLAVQLAKRAGARVLGTCSTATKAEAAVAAGCDHALRYDQVDFADEASRLTGGRGCDLVLDSVGRATFAASVRSTRIRGTIVLFGQSSGPVEPFSPRALLGSRTLVTASLFDYVRDPAERAARWSEVAELASRGELRLAIDRVHPLADAALAHRRLEGRETSGKLLLAVA